MKTTKEIVREKFLEGVTSIDCPCKTPDCKVKMYFPDDIINYFANLIESERAGLREKARMIHPRHLDEAGGSCVSCAIINLLDNLNSDKRD